MNNFAKIIFFSLAMVLLIRADFLLSQNQDSLLQKINNIDIALDTPPDSEENLYLNTVSFQSFYDLLTPVGEWIQISKDEIDEDMGDGTKQGYSSNTDDEKIVYI